MKNKLILFLFLLFAACSPDITDKKYETAKSDGEPVYGDAFITAIASDASFLNPILAGDTASSAVNAMLFNGLLKYDENLNIACDLSEIY
jgi:peptide/nickel transport system substrate-binding protein